VHSKEEDIYEIHKYKEAPARAIIEILEKLEGVKINWVANDAKRETVIKKT